MPASATPNFGRVLVVEDDPTLAANLVEYLETLGWQADYAHDGRVAMARMSMDTFEVIVLDLGLPRTDGLTVLRHLRQTLRQSTPVLVLSARDALASKLDALHQGADDYLTKPFALAEVHARLCALSRRARSTLTEEIHQTGSLRLDRRAHQAYVGIVPLKLTPRSMQILTLLLRDPGRIITRQQLEAELWPHDPPSAEALRSQIHLLRTALSNAGFHGLETVHGVGYRLTQSARYEP